MVKYYFFPLMDTLTIDQHMLFFSECFNGFSLPWYSMLRDVIFSYPKCQRILSNHILFREYIYNHYIKCHLRNIHTNFVKCFTF